jgi:hypothetical protein
MNSLRYDRIPPSCDTQFIIILAITVTVTVIAEICVAEMRQEGAKSG